MRLQPSAREVPLFFFSPSNLGIWNRGAGAGFWGGRRRGGSGAQREEEHVSLEIMASPALGRSPTHFPAQVKRPWSLGPFWRLNLILLTTSLCYVEYLQCDLRDASKVTATFWLLRQCQV